MIGRARMLTARDVAEFLGVTVETVLRWHRSGRLPGYRVGGRVLRFDPVELELVRSTRVATAGRPATVYVSSEDAL